MKLPPIHSEDVSLLVTLAGIAATAVGAVYAWKHHHDHRITSGEK